MRHRDPEQGVPPVNVDHEEIVLEVAEDDIHIAIEVAQHKLSEEDEQRAIASQQMLGFIMFSPYRSSGPSRNWD